METTIGFFVIVLSFLKIGIVPSIKSDGMLSTTRTYKIVRHPIYFGTIVAQSGLILANQALMSLIYLPFSIILYYLMASIEEKDLVNFFGNQYIEYRRYHLRQEPYAVVPHVRICGGGAGQPAFLPRPFIPHQLNRGVAYSQTKDRFARSKGS